MNEKMFSYDVMEKKKGKENLFPYDSIEKE